MSQKGYDYHKLLFFDEKAKDGWIYKVCPAIYNNNLFEFFRFGGIQSFQSKPIQIQSFNLISVIGVKF